MVVSHGLDRFQRTKYRREQDGIAVRPGPVQASLLRVAERLPLGSVGRAGRADAGFRRDLAGVVGHRLPHRVGLHSTWLVNSATHMWGARRFATRDDSRNIWWVALLTFGEGWHNNHHAHPTSARHGLAWYEFDTSWIQIRILKFFGLAKSVQTVTVNSALPEALSERQAA